MEETIQKELEKLVDKLLGEYLVGDLQEEWDLAAFTTRLDSVFNLHQDFGQETERGEIREQVLLKVQSEFQKIQIEWQDASSPIQRMILLESLDEHWQEHLAALDYLREGIHLRGFAQIEPLVAYKNEAYYMFQETLSNMWEDFFRTLFHAEVTFDKDYNNIPQRRNYQEEIPTIPSVLSQANGEDGTTVLEEPVRIQTRRVEKKVGRNEICPFCESGKKFKNCHGK
jgi:preprotein translocase subunit SecA